MEREQLRPFLPARISAQIIPIGVRDIVLPPIPTESPSRTNEAASSSETTFSRRLRSRRDRSPRSPRWVGGDRPAALSLTIDIFPRSPSLPGLTPQVGCTRLAA